MDHIFGDSDDITFGTSSPQKSLSKSQKVEHRGERPIRAHKPAPRRILHRDTLRSQEVTLPAVPEDDSLTRLIRSMKASFLPKEDDMNILRTVILSSGHHHDPLLLMTRDDETILIGSGFGSVSKAGKEYSTFPDMRLVFSEKDHLSAWILTDESMDVLSMLAILPGLGFPPIYASRGLIARFREEIKDSTFLEKCRFFELFSGGAEDRRIGAFELSVVSCEGVSCLAVKTGGIQIGLGYVRFSGTSSSLIHREQVLIRKDDNFLMGDEVFSSGEILSLRGRTLSRHSLRFTFDTFYIDGNSVGILAGYTLGDREQLAENGVLTFTLEEDARARTIAGHIFIDSRGFVHAYEMMAVHKEILKGIRATYEKLILENERIERGELVQSLRREITKYCYLLTGRTPVVMPIVIER